MYQQRMRDIYDQLSPGYRRIADYLFHNYREAAFMTAAEVARSAQVDTTSVVRFAQRLGYPGYPELIAEVQEEVKRDLREIYEPAADDGSPASVFQRALIEDRNNLDYILLHNDAAEVDRIVKLLAAARRILLVGESAAGYLAELFALRLTSLGLQAWALNGDMVSRMSLTAYLGSEDVMVGIAPTAMSTGVAVVLKVGRQEGIHTVAIAGSPTYRAAQAAEHVLYAPAHSSGGLYYAPGAVTSVIHGLVQALSVLFADRSADWAVRADYLMRRFVEVMREEPAMSVREVLREFSAGKGAQAGLEAAAGSAGVD